jgi:hypothetical protein
MAKLTTLKEQYENGLRAKGFQIAYHGASKTKWQLPNREWSIWVGVSGSLRIGRTQANSILCREVYKQELIACGVAHLKAAQF